MSQKIRLDLHLIKKGLVPSRQKAQQLIRAGKVLTQSGRILDKPGLEVDEGLEIRIKESRRFVSRGGEKLIEALNKFEIDVEGKICLDGGISTGGFTDCLLQNGAKKVYGIDVGYGQTAWSLRNDPRVVLRERTNLRKLTADELYGPQDIWPSFAVADLSFISLKLVLPVIRSLLNAEKAEALLLIKPQFEVGRDRVGKKGVVRDAAAHIDALQSLIQFASSQEWKAKGFLPCPITGPAGNHEYFLWLSINQSGTLPDIQELVEKTLS